MSDINVAVIIDAAAVPRFARDAIDELRGCDSITVFACTNTRSKRRPVRHGAYYALNLLTVRNPRTRSVPLDGSRKKIVRTVEFESGYEGAWQTLPDEVIEEMRASGFDVVLKFGMGLLRVPPPEVLPVPILSYHHGDPDRFRGRPAGFWETMEACPVMGQIVQVIGNKLDAGKVVAFAETQVRPHSYRGTLIEAYGHSPLLINAAVRNAMAGIYLEKGSAGKNYRLPSNFQVVKLLARLSLQFMKRLFYGAAMEKGWRVSLAPGSAADLVGAVQGEGFPDAGTWRTLATAPRYAFYADPFFSDDPPGLLVEAMDRRTGLGEIVHIDGERHSRVSACDGHLSYPSTLRVEGRQFIIPEMAVASLPRCYVLEDGRMKDQGPLRVDAGSGIIDPTLIEHCGRLYLFGNLLSVGPNALFLWSSPSLSETFEMHPLSPVKISPLGARMAGGLVSHRGRLFRFGQNSAGDYGDGILGFEIHELSEQAYRETALGDLRFTDRKGPHTVNVREGQIVFDWYRDRLAPMAGLRRLKARLRSRGTASPP